MKTTWQDLQAAEFHQAGLAFSLDGEFEQADDAFRQASDLVHANPIEMGHLHRDWARVYAGLGYVAGRDVSIKLAVANHLTAHEGNSTSETKSELGASYGVRARINLAKSIENPNEAVSHQKQMALDYQRALDLLVDPLADSDYLSQVLSHGSLALAGTESDVELRDRFIKVGEERTPGLVKSRKLDLERTSMIDAARVIRRSKTARYVLNKSGFVESVVAGPYIIK